MTPAETTASVRPMRNKLLASTLFLAALSPFSAVMAQAADPAVLTPERVFANPSLAGPVARGVSLSPDGELVAFLFFYHFPPPPPPVVPPLYCL